MRGPKVEQLTNTLTERRRTRANSHYTISNPTGIDGTPVSLVPVVGVAGLPVLAISRSGLRRVALVVLDRRLRVRCSRVLDLRRRPDAESRLETVRRVVHRVIVDHHIAAIAVEVASKKSPAPPGFREALHGIAEEERIWIQERAPFTAMRMMGIDGSRTDVVAELAVEYPELARRLDFRRPSLFRDRDHERSVRPLVHAFVLAHAVSLEASRGAPRPRI
ncbi:MAG: hypothetical protein ABIO72_00695 [Patescibacteria group bacterium]